MLAGHESQDKQLCIFEKKTFSMDLKKPQVIITPSTHQFHKFAKNHSAVENIVYQFGTLFVFLVPIHKYFFKKMDSQIVHKQTFPFEKLLSNFRKDRTLKISPRFHFSNRRFATKVVLTSNLIKIDISSA